MHTKKKVARKRRSTRTRKRVTEDTSGKQPVDPSPADQPGEAVVRNGEQAAADTVPVTDEEDQAEAKHQENRIATAMHKGTQAAWEMADAITIFHDRRLYRFEFDDKPSSFAKWGRTKYGLGHSRLYQLIDLRRLETNVPDVHCSGQLTEFALRPLAKLEEPDQKKCWGEITEKSGGKPEDVTPAVIKKTVREMFPPEHDEQEHSPERDEVREWIHRYLGKYREDARVGILNMIEREAVSLKVDAEKFAETINRMNEPLNLPPAGDEETAAREEAEE
jgi:hypothetical protein